MCWSWSKKNLGPEWGPIVWQDVTGSKPNTVFNGPSQSTAEVVQHCRKRKSTKRKRSDGMLREELLKSLVIVAVTILGMMGVRMEMKSIQTCQKDRVTKFYDAHV